MLRARCLSPRGTWPVAAGADQALVLEAEAGTTHNMAEDPHRRQKGLPARDMNSKSRKDCQPILEQAETVSFAAVFEDRGLPRPWDSDADHFLRHLFSPAAFRRDHTQEGAHSNADRRTSSVPHRQHSSVLVEKQLFPGAQDDNKEPGELEGCAVSQHLPEKPTPKSPSRCRSWLGLGLLGLARWDETPQLPVCKKAPSHLDAGC